MAGVRNKNKLGQYFTPAAICDFMIQLSSQGNQVKVLEPSSGAGAFLDALAQAGYSKVLGVEIDSELANHKKFSVENESFISWETDEKFDLVIGNPPYIRWKDLDQEQKDELRAHRFFGKLINSLSDYLLPFIAISIERLKVDGELIFITPSFWLQTKHSKPIRDFLDSHGRITDLVDFGETQIFKGVATSLVIFRFVKSQDHLPIRLHRFIGKALPDVKLNLNDHLQFRSEEVSHFRVQDKFVPAYDDEVELPLLLEEHCRSTGVDEMSDGFERLGNYVKIANGMVTGLDEAFKLSLEQVSRIPSAELSGLSKVAKGKNLTRLFSPNWTYYIDIDPSLAIADVEQNYPTLLAHLNQFRDRLESRYDYGNGTKWWHWSFYRSSIFLRSNESKGFVPGKERLTHKAHVRFTLAAPNVIATQDVTAFAPLQETRESIEYIVAYLNRSSVSKWVMTFGLMKGGVAEFSEKPMSEIPFRVIDWTDPDQVAAHEEITTLVRSVLAGELSSENAESRIQQVFRKLLPDNLCD